VRERIGWPLEGRARSFRRHTGYSLHGYRTQLRLRAALERLADGDEDLADIAGAVGYSSHSHLTASFHRVFGAPPSAVRGVVSGLGCGQTQHRGG
jgi:transcriptional regulator GlxA family with amidase domain